MGNDVVGVTEEARFRHAVRHVAAVPQGHRGVAQPRVLVVAPMSGHFATLLRGTVVGPAAGSRRLYHRLEERPGYPPVRRHVRVRRVCRSSDPLPGGHGGRQPHDRGMSARGGRFGRGGGNGRTRQPGTAAQSYADGWPDRHPSEPDQGQRTREIAHHRVVREETDRQRALEVHGRASGACIPASCN